MASEWNDLEEFVAVARAGGFTAGAKLFGASVTHMSRSVARLEARLQAQLFVRTTRSIRLTDTGRLFFESCTRLIREREEAIAEVTSRGKPRGTLRITCSHALGERFIAPLAMQFARDHPTLNIRLNLDNGVVDLIAKGYDIAIRTGHLPDSRLIGVRIAERAFLTVAAPSYLKTAGEPETSAALAEHECLVGMGAWRFADGRKFKPQGRWSANSGTIIRDALLDGMGIGQLPAFYVQEDVARGALVEILAHERAEAEPIWAVYPERRHLSPKVREMVNLLKSRLPALLG